MLHSGMLSWPPQSSSFSPFSGHSKMLPEVPQIGASGPDLMRGQSAPPPRIRILTREPWRPKVSGQEWTKKGVLTPQIKPSYLSGIKLPTENHSKDSWAKEAQPSPRGKQNGGLDATSPFIWKEISWWSSLRSSWVSQNPAARIPYLGARTELVICISSSLQFHPLSHQDLSFIELQLILILLQTRAQNLVVWTSFRLPAQLLLQTMTWTVSRVL